MSYVLVVDDDPQIHSLIARSLRSAGHAVKCASTAAQGLALLTGEPPSVLLSDLGLPDQNGSWLIEHARSHLPALPVVIMSGSSQPESVDDVQFLQKPFGRDDLLAMVERARTFRNSLTR